MNIRTTLDNFFHRIRSLRSVTLLLIWLCMLDIELGIFREEALMLGEKDTFVILPFIQADGYFSKVILIGVLCFFSNAPFMDKSEIYVISRIGRGRWGMRNIIYVFMSSILLSLLFVCLSSLTIFPVANLSNEWGKIYHTFSAAGIGSAVYISGKTIAAFAPFQLLAHIVIIDTLVFALLGMLLYTFSLYLPRICGYLFAIMLAFLPTMDWIPFDTQYFSPCSWINPGSWRYGQDMNYPSLIYIYTALLLLLVVLGWAGQSRIHRAAWVNREEV